MKNRTNTSDELKKMQRSLRESEEKYRGIFENAVEGMFQTTCDGRFITMNPALARMMGFNSPAEAIAKIADIAREIYVNPEDRTAYRKILEEKGVVNGYETRIYGKDREMLWVSISARAVTLNGKVGYYEGSIENITERKKAEIAVSTLEDLESSILSAIPHAVVGLEGRRIIFANEAVRDVFGWEPGDLVEKSTRVLYRNDEEYEEIGRRFYPALKSVDVHIEEFSCRHKDGSDVLCLISASRIGCTLEKQRIVAVYQNITARKQIECALQESEEKYRKIFENSVEGIFQSTPDGRYITVNPTMARIYGYESVEEFLAKIEDIGTQIYVDPQRRRELVRLLEEEGSVSGFESLQYRKDGSKIWVVTNARAIKEKDGRIAYCEGTIIDITERTKVKEALRESEEMYRNMLESFTTGAYIIQDGIFKYVNRAYAEIFRYVPEEIVDKMTPLDLAPLAERHHISDNLEKPGHHYDIKAMRKDGTVFDAMVMAKRSMYKGKPALVGMLIDITERKESEKALRESEECYRTAIEHSNDGVTLIRGGIHIYVNQRFVEMFGYTSTEEIVGKEQFSIVHPDDREKVAAISEKRWRGEDAPSRYEYRGIKKDGTAVEIEVSATKTTYKGEPVILCYLRDITERKRSERALNETMERLSKSANAIVDVIVLAVESRDPYTAGHQRRVAALAAAIARKMALSDAEIEGLTMAGMIHDLGKISIPAEILTTPRRLTELEYELMKVHSQIGFNILRNVDFPWPIADIVHQHHERIDGSGYPLGLKGDEIRVEAKILAVADSFEAIASHRPYRPSQGIDVAVSEIRKGRGVVFDPAVADICVRLFMDEGFLF